MVALFMGAVMFPVALNVIALGVDTAATTGA